MGLFDSFLLPADYLKLYNEAQKIYGESKYNEALQILHKAEKIYDKSSDFWNLKGLCYLSLDNIDNALSSFNNAIKITNNFLIAYYNIGICYYHKGLFDEAIRQFRYCLKNGYKENIVHYYLAWSYIKTAQYNIAKTEVEAFLSCQPGSALGHFALGIIYSEVYNFNSAIEYFIKSIKYDEALQDSYIQLGYCYNKIGAYNDAAKIAKLLTSKFNEKIYSSLILASANTLQENYTEAWNYYKLALESDPDNVEVIREVANYFFVVKQYTKSIECYYKIIKFNENDLNALYSLALNYIEINNFDKAIEYAEKINNYCMNASDKTYNKFTSYVLGYSYTYLNKNKEALEHLNLIEEAFEHTEAEYVISFYLRGRTFFQSNSNLNDAINYLKKFVEFETNAQIFNHYKISKLIPEAKDILSKAYLLQHKDNSSINEEELNNRIEGGFANVSKNIYYLLKQTHNIIRSNNSLINEAEEIFSILEQYDKPLNLVVVGEFSSGKSTFINALIGEEIAPMGVGPTTATINVFKYGIEKAVRIIKENDLIEEIGINDLNNYIEENKSAEIQKIKHIEIFYPIDILKNVNIIDTPGLNAPIKAHEILTKDFLKNSDAILWLFTADNAGKATEKRSLEFIKNFSRKTIAVINKIDKLEDINTLKNIITDLKADFKNCVENFCPVSSKFALKGKIANSSDQINKSNFPKLIKFLDQEIFIEARKIKNFSATTRYKNIINKIKEINNDLKNNNVSNSVLISKTYDNFSERFKILTSYYNKNDFNMLLKQSITKLAKEVESFFVPAQGFFDSNKIDDKYVEYIKDELTNFFISIINISINKIIKSFSLIINEILETYRQLFDKLFVESTSQTYILLLNEMISNSEEILKFKLIEPNCNICAVHINLSINNFINNQLKSSFPSQNIEQNLYIHSPLFIVEKIESDLNDWILILNNKLNDFGLMLKNSLISKQNEIEIKVLSSVVQLIDNLKKNNK